MDTENQSHFDHFENQLTYIAVVFLKESAKWSKFLAIVGFVGIGLMILAGFFMMFGMSSLGASNNMPFSMAAFSLVYLILAAVYFFPVYYLYQYGAKTTLALRSKNQQLLTDGLGNLKSHHKFLGIFTLILISIYGLFFVFAIIAGILS